MRSNVRALLLLALALVACSDDSRKGQRGGDVPGDRDGGGLRPTGAVQPMSPACEALHAETVFQSDGYSVLVRDARASAGGHVLLLLDEQAAPDAPAQTALRVVHTPSGPAKRDVAVSGAVLALSDAQAERVALVAGGREGFGPVSVATVELATGMLTGARPLEDLSNQPRLHYDDAGQVVHQVATRGLTLARHGIELGAVQIAQLADGGQAVLAFVVDPLPTQGQAVGVWLFVFEPDGRFRARAQIKSVRAGLLGGLGLQRGPDDRLHVLVSLHRSERAGFERIHARTLETPDFVQLPVLLTFSPLGKLELLREAAPAECARPLDASAGALDVDAQGVTWSGRCDAERAWIASTPASAAAPVAITQLALGAGSQVGSLLRHASGAVFVAGARNFAQREPGELRAPGDALLARIDPDGSTGLACPYDTPRHDRFLLRRSQRSLVILQYDGWTSGTSDEARAGSVVRYVAP